MAYAPAGGAVDGQYATHGYEGGGPAATGIAIGDPRTGLTAVWAIMAAVVARQIGEGAATRDVAMLEASPQRSATRHSRPAGCP